MPFWVLVTLVVAGAAAFSVGGVLFVRKAIPLRALESQNAVTGSMHEVVGVLYAVLLAFTVLAGWDRYDQAEDVADREANAVADLFRASGAYPEDVRQRLRAKLRAYTESVIAEEWPELARGRASRRAWTTYNELWEEYLGFRPGSEQEAKWHAQCLAWLGNLSDARRMRLLRSESGIPTVLWVVLCVGGVVTIGFSCMYGLPGSRAHAIMTGALGATLALILVVLSGLEHPYRGEIRIEPKAFAEALQIFENLVER